MARELNLSEEIIGKTLLQLPRPISLENQMGKEHNQQFGDLLEDSHDTPGQDLALEQLHNDLDA